MNKVVLFIVRFYGSLHFPLPTSPHPTPRENQSNNNAEILYFFVIFRRPITPNPTLQSEKIPNVRACIHPSFYNREYPLERGVS